MTLMEIKEEVLPTLTPEEKLELRRAICEYDKWDLQMIADGKPGGKLARRREEALAAHRRGETEEWP